MLIVNSTICKCNTPFGRRTWDIHHTTDIYSPLDLPHGLRRGYFFVNPTTYFDHLSSAFFFCGRYFAKL